ncbi:hypothetical protein EZI54_19720 [Marinobacter halodurans]|uniref:Uncharacterized protein n=1 Tax=Marinobacter halodurans TaxID=2528979 RepID=A0ABY1ZJB4_9GAMM|nr:DUF6421 family protein [Marinobacter halodurans]TBW49358.1 hypothetical protein EZI54_19720 [Marinobacter halodurans]
MSIEYVDYINNHIVPRVHRLQALQSRDGSIRAGVGLAEGILRDLIDYTKPLYVSIGLEETHESLAVDIEDWIVRGLDKTPYFDNTINTFTAPENHSLTFFLGPMRTPNGPNDRGFYLEAFFAKREEPSFMAPIAAEMPHPKNGCQSLKLLAGSKGFTEEKCIVFFPENVRTRNEVHLQNYAMFFFNKFFRIFNQETILRAKSVFSIGALRCEKLTEDEYYEARVLWGYLHDYFHHVGHRPFDQNIQVKMNFFVGILEEIRADVSTVLALNEKRFKYWDAIIEFILFERLLRYPSQHDATNNFDSGTGFFLFTWLWRNSDCFQHASDGRLSFNFEACVESLSVLLSEIDSIEAIAHDQGYKEAARRYVEGILASGEDGERFAIPEDFVIQRANSEIEVPYLVF